MACSYKKETKPARRQSDAWIMKILVLVNFYPISVVGSYLFSYRCHTMDWCKTGCYNGSCLLDAKRNETLNAKLENDILRPTKKKTLKYIQTQSS